MKPLYNSSALVKSAAIFGQFDHSLLNVDVLAVRDTSIAEVCTPNQIRFAFVLNRTSIVDPIAIQVEFCVKVIVAVSKFLEVWLCAQRPVVKHHFIIWQSENSVPLHALCRNGGGCCTRCGRSCCRCRGRCCRAKVRALIRLTGRAVLTTRTVFHTHQRNLWGFLVAWIIWLEG